MSVVRCGGSRVAWIECVSREMWREPEDRVAWTECVSREMWRELEDRVWPG